MSTTIENRIINLQFNNADFEKNTAQTMNTIDKLKSALKFDGISKGFTSIANAASKVSLNSITTATTEVSKGFTALERMAIGALENIGRKAENMAESFIKSVSVDQISSGFEKYAENTKAVQVMMNATGESMEVIQELLDKLSWYTDETSYAFTDMTNNISKFTNAGVNLEDATAAMIGIGNAAGLAGTSVQDASHAMAGFSKAMGAGYMSLQNWSWIQTAHMDTVEFKQSLIDIAAQLGYIEKGEITLENFNETLGKKKWLTKDVIVEALARYSKATDQLYDIYTNGDYSTTSEIIEDMGDALDQYSLKAFKASQEAKTFEDAIEAVKDAVSTGWMKTFDAIFGNYTEARVLWTDFANWLYDMFAESGNVRNEMLKIWRGEGTEELLFGPEGLTGRQYFLEALYSVFDTLTEYINRFKNAWNSVFGEFDIYTLASITEQFHRFAQLFEHTLNDTEETFNDPERKRSGVISQFHLIVREFASFVKEIRDLAIDFTTIIKYAFIDSFGNVERDWAYFEGFSGWIINLIVGAKSLVEQIHSVFIESDRLYRIATGLMSVVKMVWSILEYMGKVSFVSGNSVLGTIVELIATIGDALTITKDSKFSQVMKEGADATLGVLKVVLGLLEKGLAIVINVKDMIFEFIVELSDRLKQTGSLETFFDGFVRLAKSIAELTGADRILKFFTDLSTVDKDWSFLDIGVTVVDALISVLGTLMDTVANTVETITPFIHTALNLFRSLFSAIFGTNDSSMANGVLAGNASMQSSENKTIFDIISDKIGLVSGNVRNLLTNIFTNIDHKQLAAGTTQYSETVFGGIVAGISNGIETLTSKFDAESIKQVGGVVGLLASLFLINKNLLSLNTFWKTLTHIPLNIGDIFSNFSSILSNIAGTIGQVKKSIKSLTDMQIIQTLVKAIVSIVMAIVVLASIPEAELYKAFKYLTLISLLLAMILKMVSNGGVLYNVSGNMKNVTKITQSLFSGNNVKINAGNVGIAGFMLSLTAFVAVLIYAFKELNKYSPKQLITGGVVLVAFLAVITAVVGIVVSFSKSLQTTVRQTSHIITTPPGGTSTNRNSKSTYTNYGSSYLWSVAGMIFAISVGVKIISDSIIALAKSCEDTTGGTIAGIAIVFGIIGTFMLMLYGFIEMLKHAHGIANPTDLAKSLILYSVSMAIISASVSLLVGNMLILAAALSALFLLPDGQGLAAYLIAFVTIIGFMAALTGMMYLIVKMSTITGGGWRKIIFAATSLAIAAGAIIVLVAAMIPLFMMFAASSLAKNNAALAAAGFITGWLVAFAGILAAMGAASMLGLTGSDAIKMASAIVIISASFIVIAGAMAIMAAYNVKWGHMGQLLITFGVAILALLGTMTLIYKVFAGSDMTKYRALLASIKNITNAFLAVSASFVIISIGLAILANIPYDDIISHLWMIIAVFGVLVLTVAGIALIAKKIPTAAAVVKAFAVLIAAMAAFQLGWAATFLTFSILLATADKHLVSLTQKLGPFKDALVGFFRDMAPYSKDAMTFSIAMTILGLAIAELIVSIVYLIVHYHSAIGSALSSLFTHIRTAIHSFGTWLSGLPVKTKALISSIVLSVGTALATASPQVYSMIEVAFMTIMERLGDSAGWIVEGLFKLLLKLLIGLADAVKNNSELLAFAIMDILVAIGEVVIDLVNMIFTPIINVMIASIGALIKSGLGKLNITDGLAETFTEVITAVLTAMSPALNTIFPGLGALASSAIASINAADLRKSINNTIKEGATFEEAFNDIYSNLEETNKVGIQDLKDNIEDGMGYLADKYRIGDLMTKSIWTDDDKKNAQKQVDESTSAIQKTLDDKIGILGTQTQEKMMDAKEKVTNTVTDFFGSFDLSQLIQKLNLGEIIDVSGFTNMLTGADGAVNTDALNQINNLMNGSEMQVDPETMQNWEAAKEQLGLTGDAAEEASVGLESLAVTTDQAADSTGLAVETIAENSAHAEEDMTYMLDNLEKTVDNKQQDFFTSGQNLIQALQNGIDDKWNGVAGSIKSKFQTLADEIKKAFELGDLTVSIGTVTPVYNGSGSSLNMNAPASSLWMNPTTSNEPYANNPAFTSWSMATSAASNSNTYGNQNITSSIEANTQEIKNMQQSMDNMSDKFGAFSDTYKNTNIYLDSGELVGAMAHPMYDAFGDITMREVRSGH